ncbi:MAG TPA: hypothetical protein VHH73_03605 [Verrucomicrobiae bacterium]|nr:hypothetical protein [Verrucomicrobiae bacterium]
MNWNDPSPSATPAAAPNPAGTPPNIKELQESVRALRGVLNVVIVSLLVATIGLNVFLYRQVSMARRQISDASDYLNNYQKNTAPLIQKFIGQLQVFARTNADYAPIFQRHVPNADAPKLPAPPVPSQR